MSDHTTRPAGQVGGPAPEFTLDACDNGQFKQISLADYKGRWLVLFFYPLDFTFVCPTEVLAYSDRLGEFEDLGCAVLGASIDSQFTHLAWTERSREQGGIQGLRYPLLADVRKELALKYGVLDTEAGVALRGLFVIDPDGVIQHATINNLAIGRSVDETLRVVQAAQYTREHGEVCPANWKPGQDAMKADWNESKAYFGKSTATTA